MTEETFKKRFSGFMEQLYSFKKLEALTSQNHNWTPGTLPYSTGNMSQVAFRMEKIDDTHYKLIIDSGIAPYVSRVNDTQSFYTNNFWRMFAQKVAEDIATKYNGDMTSGGNTNGSGD